MITTKSVWTMSSTGTILRDGKPFYLHGGYTVSWTDGRAGALRDIAAAKRLGWNCLQVAWIYELSIAANVALFDAAAAADIYLIIGDIGIAEGEVWPEQIEAINNHPAIMGVQTADDANNYPYQDVRATRARLKTLCPRLLSYLSFATAMDLTNGSIAEYCGSSDLISNQTYPFPSEPAKTIVTETEKLLAPCAAAASAPVATLDWQTKAGNIPICTNEQLRAQGYLALNSGAPHVLWYALNDQYNRNGGQEEHLAILREIRIQHKELEPWFTKGTRSVIATGDNASAVTWTLGGRALTIVVNVTPGKLRLSVPVPAGLSIHHIDGPMRARGAYLSGELPGYGVAVIRSS